MEIFNSWELAALTAAVVLVGYRYRQSSLYPYPPGPRKLPLVGNFFSLPSSYPWKTWAEWGRKYDSDIIHVSVAGQSMVILNTYEAAKELLEKKSAIYSSRPISVMLSELCGMGYQFGLMPYGEPWRIRRRLFKKYLNPSNAVIHQLQEDKYVLRFLTQLLERPAELVELLNHMVGSISLSVTYGVDILPENDPNMQVAHRVTEIIKAFLTAGTAIVDLLPILKYLPPWFPGAGFHKIAANSRELVFRLRDGVFQNAYNKWSTCAAPTPSLVTLFLEDCQAESAEASEEQMTALKDVASNIYTAAHDSSIASLQTFILAMTCFPEIQKRAQQELDEVVGLDRLPVHSDASKLPYLSALVKEVFRWQAIVPAGVPHKSTAPDVYKGYYIPEGSTIIYNSWAMLNNETDYPEPREFRPERFLNSDGQLKSSDEVRNPLDIVFGFGRRICPGSHIGLSVFWKTVASMLAVYNIEKAVDSNGHPIEPTCEYTPGAVSVPLPFACSIKPRSPTSVALIREIKETTSNME